jgi:hypothetical protein
MEVDRLRSSSLQLLEVRDAIDERTQPTLVDRKDNLDQVFLFRSVCDWSSGNRIIACVPPKLLNCGSGGFVSTPQIAGSRVRFL